VWGKLGRQHWWPGIVVEGYMVLKQQAQPNTSWIFWFGDHKISQVNILCNCSKKKFILKSKAVYIMEEKFEDTKVVIRIRKSQTTHWPGEYFV